MGEPVGDPYVEGVRCDWCWGPGKAFGDEATPKYVAIIFSGLVDIWAACNKKYIGQQQVGFPCIWLFEDANFRGYYQFSEFGTHVEIEAKWDPDIWIGFDSGVCDDSFIG